MAPSTTSDFEYNAVTRGSSHVKKETSFVDQNSSRVYPSQPAAAQILEGLDPSSLPVDVVSKFSLSVFPNALDSVNVPVFAYRSRNPGPVIGITCAIHGNEVNGIPVIQKLFADIERAQTPQWPESECHDAFSVKCGTIIGIPVVNVPGFLASIRCFDDESKQDLNRLMPGKPDGAAPQQYAHSIFDKIITKFDYVIDLHTASAGRSNSLYVRADMNHPIIGKLARLMQPQVLVHVATGGSLRGCAQEKGIHALTVEIGSASVFQNQFILATYAGIRRVIASIGLSSPYDSGHISDLATELGTNDTAVCSRSFWIFSTHGGILKVFKKIAERVEPRELIAEIQSIFGDPVERIYAPDYETVVVGVEGNPVAKGGNRVIHLGVLGGNFAAVANDGHL